MTCVCLASFSPDFPQRNNKCFLRKTLVKSLELRRAHHSLLLDWLPAVFWGVFRNPKRLFFGTSFRCPCSDEVVASLFLCGCLFFTEGRWGALQGTSQAPVKPTGAFQSVPSISFSLSLFLSLCACVYVCTCVCAHGRDWTRALHILSMLQQLYH